MKKKEKKIKVIWNDEAKKSLRSVYDHIKDRESVRVAQAGENRNIKTSQNSITLVITIT